MGKIRRIRYGPYHKVLNENPYRDQSKDPQYDHRNVTVINTYEEAFIRQLSRDGIGWNPGGAYQLCIPFPNLETGSMIDVDGDRAIIRVEMVGASVNLFYHDSPSYKGFVSKENLVREEEYRKGNIFSAYDKDQNLDYEFVLEEWFVLTQDET
jgi:hypothetical protein